MKWRNYIVFLIIPIFLISSTGVVVYEHHCSHAGSFTGYFTEVDHNCDEQPKLDHCEMESEDCCSAETKPSPSPEMEEECCSTEVLIFQIDSDYTEVSYEIDFDNSFVTISSKDNVGTELFSSQIEKDRAPPNLVLPSSQRRSLFQVYLI